ncbi:lipocalin family protein [Hymenobacter cellulosilyticus]|uniref:Lipocalin family protein n=1 Tax=Hymenobacter cellulosilyticus TaxID=2932248 RepID=A0A8T9Q529_9BACT|nr:lipocalin family protein [Hymenobacter cellulosilyticus]UOQ72786.1 lipocalin family protein [Hymenobacter cellulosilyticus]
MKRSSLLVLLSLALGFTACEKDEEVPQDVQLLTAKNWRMSANVTTFVYPAGNARRDVDNYSASPACDHDDFWKFAPDKTMVIDEGASKCEPSAPQSNPAQWNLDATNRTLSVIAGTTRTYELLELTASTLKFKQDNGLSPIDGAPYYTTYTFTSF